MIQKVIHFCWLSDEPFPPLVKKCIDTWKKVLPDYEIIRWDTKRFDIDKVTWVKEAFSAKKYAFAADYIRFYALYHYGGIYLDSDVEMLKSFNSLLNNKTFIGYENVSGLLEPAIIGAEKGASWCKKMMNYYESRHFNGMNMKVAPLIISELFAEEITDYPSIPVRKPTLIAGGDILLCPPEYFSPIKIDADKNYNKTSKDTIGDLRLNPNTYCIHRFNGSWVTPWRKRVYDLVDKTIGTKTIRKMIDVLHIR